MLTYTRSLFLLITLLWIQTGYSQQFEVSIPLGGNAWLVNDLDYKRVISDQGVRNWNDPNQIIRIYFHVGQIGKVKLGMKARTVAGNSTIHASYVTNSSNIQIHNTAFAPISIGEFEATKVGYYYVDLQGLHRTGQSFAEVTELLIGGAVAQSINFSRDEFYWSRRGPSVHLGYDIAGKNNIEWFYNEIEVPEGEDVIGSYYMANGFNGGYFGIQVNSATQRKVLFSIWSPYQTDDPSKIPDEYKVQLLKKGAQVTTGKFGNEGSGGQSYMIRNWKTNTRYRFLMRAQPVSGNFTIFTAYFFDPAIGKWELIASFKRPKTTTYLKGLYSFLENFKPKTGSISRKCGFYNQWICDTNGNWTELNRAKFTADNTARKKNRLDYSGGVGNQGFFLKNCGFTNDYLQVDTWLQRAKMGRKPNIDFESLK